MSLVFVAIVIGLVIFIRFFVKDVYFSSRLITGNSTLTDNSVYCFAPGGKDRLWIGTENGINYYSYSTHQLKELAVQANGTKVKYVHSIDQTNDSTLWISTVGEGIVKVTLENQRKDPIVKHATRTLVSNGHMASDYFFTSYRESSSTLWFGNRGLGAPKQGIVLKGKGLVVASGGCS